MLTFGNYSNHVLVLAFIKLKLISAVATSIVLGWANSSNATIWRSQSGKTIIPNLDAICWGYNSLDSVQTVFNESYYFGNVFFDYIITRGCSPGDRLSGYFNLFNDRSNCSGSIDVTWQKNNQAFIEWDIQNSTCPIKTTHWEIDTYPTMQKTTDNAINTVTVFAPPSNIRATPNGRIICSIKSVIEIDVVHHTNGWYQTNVCGSRGYIHHSQIRF